MQRSENSVKGTNQVLRQFGMIENSDKITRTTEKQMHSNVFKQ